MSQSPLILWPSASQSAALLVPDDLLSGDSLVLVDLVGPFVQASDIPVDTVPIASAAAFNTANNFLEATYNADVASSRAGFRNGHVYLTRQISDILPGYDPTVHEIVAYLDKGDTASGTNELLCSLCVIDESTASGTAQGVGGGWTQSSGTTDGVSVVQATAASVSNEANAPCRGAFLRWDFNPVAATWAVNFTIRGDPTGTDGPAPNPVNNNYVRSSPESCYFMLSLGKRLTDSVTGQVGRVRAKVGYKLRLPRPNF